MRRIVEEVEAGTKLQPYDRAPKKEMHKRTQEYPRTYHEQYNITLPVLRINFFLFVQITWVLNTDTYANNRAVAT